MCKCTLGLILVFVAGCNALTSGALPTIPPTSISPRTAATVTALEKPTAVPAPTRSLTLVAAASGAVRAAVLRLSHEGIANPNLVSLVDITPALWTDDCLGLVSVLTCHSKTTPGYIIELQLAGQHYLFHTDREGKQARLASSPAASPFDVFIQWSYVDNTVCKNALIGKQKILYGICGEATLSWTLSEAPSTEPTIVNQSQAAYLERRYASFSANTVRGTLVFTGTGTIRPSEAEQRAIAEWASFAWAQADFTYLSADVGLSLFWTEQTNTLCGGLWIYETAFAVAWDCPGTRVVNSGLLSPRQMEQFYAWIDSGGYWNISRAEGTGSQSGRVSLYFPSSSHGVSGSSSSNDEEQVLQFAHQVYSQLAR